ncbi:ABC transporter substrate-binding protein, partial [Cupriavidus sp. SIMBA_020]
MFDGRLKASVLAVCVAAAAALGMSAAKADPVSLNIVDVAGNLQLTQKAF